MNYQKIKFNLSLLVLISANFFPLFAVLFYGWDFRLLLYLYWLENLIVGFFNIARIATVKDKEAGIVTRLLMIVFFCFHFGLFTLIHGFFILALAGTDYSTQSSQLAPVSDYQTTLSSTALASGMIVLFISHAYSYFANFWLKGERKRTGLIRLFFRPYPRIIVMHFTIFWSSYLITIFKQPVAMLVVLVILKTGLDALAHIIEHHRLQTKNSKMGKNGQQHTLSLQVRQKQSEFVFAFLKRAFRVYQVIEKVFLAIFFVLLLIGIGWSVCYFFCIN